MYNSIILETQGNLTEKQVKYCSDSRNATNINSVKLPFKMEIRGYIIKQVQDPDVDGSVFTTMYILPKDGEHIYSTGSKILMDSIKKLWLADTKRIFITEHKSSTTGRMYKCAYADKF